LAEAIDGYSPSTRSPGIHSKSVQKSVGPKRYGLFTPRCPTYPQVIRHRFNSFSARLAAIKWAIVGTAGTAPPVANANSTPDFQKFAMIRLILKLA
jgi:hypothetical protein